MIFTAFGVERSEAKKANISSYTIVNRANAKMSRRMGY